MTIKLKTRYTKKRLINFSRFNEVKSPAQVIFYILMELIMLAMGLLFILTSENSIELILSVLVITPLFLLMIPLIIWGVPLLVPIFNSGSLGCENIYELLDEEMIINSTLPAYIGECRIKYERLLRIYETSDAFYLFIARQQAFIIGKSDVSGITIPQLRKFLRNKVSKKKYFLKKKRSGLIPALTVISIAAIALATVYACKNPYSADIQEKTFSKSGLTITLTDNFSEADYASYTATYDSKDMAVFVKKEDFSIFENQELSLTEYAELIIENNQLGTVVEEIDGLICFSYVREIEGTEYIYFTTVYKGSDAYWFVQFSCDNEDYPDLKDTILQYAKSVVIL